MRFVSGNDHFFLNLVMPACKLQTRRRRRTSPARRWSTVMARNGTDFGIQTSGTGDTWFTAPANTPEGLFLGSYGPDDANPDIGDSAITETAGIGGLAMATAPAIVRFVGGSVPDALATTQRMYDITVGENPAFGIPILEFRGHPHRHRRHRGRAQRRAAADQHRDGRPGRRHRPGRRRPRHAADGVLHPGPRRPSPSRPR